MAKVEAKAKKVTATEAKKIAAQDKLHEIDSANKYMLIKTKLALKHTLSTAMGEFIAIDTETTGLDILTCCMHGFSMCWAPHFSYWIPLPESDADGNAEKLTLLAKALASKTTVLANAEYDVPVLERHGCPIGKFVDVLKAVRLLYPNEKMFSLKDASEKLLGERTVTMQELLGYKKDEIRFSDISPDNQRIYACQDADLTKKLWTFFDTGKRYGYKDISRPLDKVDNGIWKLEHDISPAIVSMRTNGIAADIDEAMMQTKKLDAMIATNVEKLQTLYDDQDVKFNLRSTSHKRRLLYDILKLTPSGYTAIKHEPSTKAEFLEEMREAHEAVGLIIDGMSWSTLRNSFTAAIPEHIHPQTGRVHPSLWALGTATGRFSCSKPNLQNVPKTIEDNFPVNVRNIFVSSPGYTFVDCDYSQIELMLAAWMSREPIWCEAYRNGVDVHTETAKWIYGVTEVSPIQRDGAKRANYSLLYGQGVDSFARKNGLDRGEAENLVRNWLSTVGQFTAWRDIIKASACACGKAYTYYNRMRPMDGIHSDNKSIKSKWERRAVSHTIQGTAADLMKIAIARVWKRLPPKEDLGVKLLLQVHDELLLEVRDDIVDEIAKIVVDRMTIRLKDFVPLKVDVKIGKRWGSVKQWKEV